jgi:hypothetical protein
MGLKALHTEDWKPKKHDIIGLYTTARKNMWTRNGVHALIQAQFKKGTSKDLTYSEYEKLLGWIEKLPPDTVTAEKDTNTMEMFT